MSFRCNICGGKLKLVHKGTRDNPDINVYECESCHTKQLDSICERDYKNGFMNGKAKLTDEEIKSRLLGCEPDDKRRFEMIRGYCVGKKVLDFGCGFGGFLSYVASVTDEVYGVELGECEREYLTEQGFSVSEDIDGLGQKFDVITLFHVFEHLKDPNEWLIKIAHNLNKGGHLFIEVPNANDILLSLYENDAFANFTYWSAHLYLYTKDSLTRIINQSGLYSVELSKGIQRYSLANTMYWLAKNGPGGHIMEQWSFLNDQGLNKQYEAVLDKNDYCDTLFFILKKL